LDNLGDILEISVFHQNNDGWGLDYIIIFDDQRGYLFEFFGDLDLDNPSEPTNVTLPGSFPSISSPLLFLVIYSTLPLLTVSTNPCAQNPCISGTCIPGDGFFTCTCDGEYQATGALCQNGFLFSSCLHFSSLFPSSKFFNLNLSFIGLFELIVYNSDHPEAGTNRPIEGIIFSAESETLSFQLSGMDFAGISYTFPLVGPSTVFLS